LQTYELVSGQAVNLHKSYLFFSKNDEEDIHVSIENSLGVTSGNEEDRYLGLPFLIGRSKQGIFSYIKERVWKKLKGWKEKLLSQAGKETIIKSVIQVIPLYAM
jgi:hypothetical protein